MYSLVFYSLLFILYCVELAFLFSVNIDEFSGIVKVPVGAQQFERECKKLRICTCLHVTACVCVWQWG